MKNNTNYFSHDCNARDDEKIMLLRAEYGWEGYGIWWLMVEKLSEATEYKLLLSNKLVISKLYLANIDIINYLFEIGLLAEDGEYMYSPSLLYRMQLKLDKKLRQSEGGKKAMLKRWENKSGSGSDKLLITSKVKESKVKESKEPIEDFESTILEFQKMRKTIKKPMTENAVKLLKKELDKLAPGDEEMQIAIMNKSIMNCWQGVFALKEDEKNDLIDPTIKEYDKQTQICADRGRSDDRENNILMEKRKQLESKYGNEKAMEIRKDIRAKYK